MILEPAEDGKEFGTGTVVVLVLYELMFGVFWFCLYL